MDGFVELSRSAGRVRHEKRYFWERYVEITRLFRPERNGICWLCSTDALIAAIEFKSQVGSFGNNYNNRTEESGWERN